MCIVFHFIWCFWCDLISKLIKQIVTWLLCCAPQVMAVEISRDLTVHVLEDVNAVKLSGTQQALREAIQRGEPKCLGVSADLSD